GPRCPGRHQRFCPLRHGADQSRCRRPGVRSIPAGTEGNGHPVWIRVQCAMTRRILGDSHNRTRRGDRMKISARNVLPGKIIAIVRRPVSTEVTIEIAPGVQLVSTITSASASSLNLSEGSKIYGVIKASSVMIAAD